jgi:hypothetical protein
MSVERWWVGDWRGETEEMEEKPARVPPKSFRIRVVSENCKDSYLISLRSFACRGSIASNDMEMFVNCEFLRI